jgi:glucose/arabinose dehydrogenase
MPLPYRRQTRPITATALLALVLLAGCSGSGDEDPGAILTPGLTYPATTPPPTGAPSPSGSVSRVPAGATPRAAGIIARDLDVPWGLAFLPGGDALVAERDTAEVKRVTPDGKVSTVGRVRDVDPGGEGGLLGLAVSPRFATDATVFAYFTADEDNRVVRITYRDDRLSGQRPILTGIPKGGIHNGGRLVFGPDGMLYVGTGEQGNPPLAQDRGSLGGKILRMTPQGGPAPGNPFGDSVVYSYGHRNVQGLAFDSAGRLWAAEFGQNTWDELNLIRPGRNYGWPEVEGRGGDDRFVEPVAQWGTDEASPSGIAIAGDAVYMAALRGSRLWRIPIEGDRVGTPRAFFEDDFGRLRTIEMAADGSLWVTTSNRDGRRRGGPLPGDDKVLRFTLR